jgi:hypothetical protein
MATSKIFPRYYLKFYDKGLLVNSLATRKKGRIIFRMRTFGTQNRWTKAFLKFQYDPEYHNEGTYCNSVDLEKAYRAFEELLPEFK